MDPFKVMYHIQFHPAEQSRQRERERLRVQAAMFRKHARKKRHISAFAAAWLTTLLNAVSGIIKT